MEKPKSWWNEKPKEWWRDPENAEKWIKQSARYTRLKDPSTKIVIDEISKNIKNNKFNSVLEVGAGDGRLIGGLSNKYENVKYCSTDINPELSKFVEKKYLNVRSFVDDVVDTSFKINSFELVYTYQVLQHVPPDEIERAIKELMRVAKKEVWMWEGIGRTDLPHGSKVHGCHGGSFVYHIDTLVNCYEVSMPKHPKLSRQRLYKIKV